MTQLFLIIAFILGFILGWKVYEFTIAQGLAYLCSKENSGVKMSEDGNKMIIDANLVLQNFKSK